MPRVSKKKLLFDYINSRFPGMVHNKMTIKDLENFARGKGFWSDAWEWTKNAANKTWEGVKAVNRELRDKKYISKGIKAIAPIAGSKAFVLEAAGELADVLGYGKNSDRKPTRKPKIKAVALGKKKAGGPLKKGLVPT